MPHSFSPFAKSLIPRRIRRGGFLWTTATVPIIALGTASIHRRPDRKYYIAAWTDVSGRRLKRSTKTTDKKLAANLARAFEDAATASKTASSLSLETGVETRSRGLFRDKCGE